MMKERLRYIGLIFALIIFLILSCKNQVTSEHRSPVEPKVTKKETDQKPSRKLEDTKKPMSKKRMDALSAVSTHPKYLDWSDKMDFIEKSLVLSKTPFSETGYLGYYENGLGVYLSLKDDGFLVEIKCEEGNVNADWGLSINSKTGEVQEEYTKKHEPDKARKKFQNIAKQKHKKQNNWKQAFEIVQARNHLISTEDLLFIEGAMIEAEEYGKDGFVGYEKWGLGLDITSKPGRFLVDILSEKGKVKNSWRARIIKNTGALIQEFPFLMEL